MHNVITGVRVGLGGGRYAWQTRRYHPTATCCNTQRQTATDCNTLQLKSKGSLLSTVIGKTEGFLQIFATHAYRTRLYV